MRPVLWVVLTSLAALCVFAVFSAPSAVFAQSNTACFVIVEKTLDDVFCTLHPDTATTKKRLAYIVGLNRKKKRENKRVEEEMKNIKTEISRSKAQLGRCKKDEEDLKSELADEIEALEERLAEKGTERKPLTKIIGPSKFKNRRAAEAYIQKQYKAADKEREKVDAKRRAEERKRKLEEARKSRAKKDQEDNEDEEEDEDEDDE